MTAVNVVRTCSEKEAVLSAQIKSDLKEQAGESGSDSGNVTRSDNGSKSFCVAMLHLASRLHKESSVRSCKCCCFGAIPKLW